MVTPKPGYCILTVGRRYFWTQELHLTQQRSGLSKISLRRVWISWVGGEAPGILGELGFGAPVMGNGIWEDSQGCSPLSLPSMPGPGSKSVGLGETEG